MTYPGPPPPAQPPRSGADMIVSIASLALTVVFGGAFTVMGFFALAFLDHCPPATCSADGAFAAVGTSVLVAAAIAVIGIIVTVIRVRQRKTAWPFGVGTMVLCGVTLLVGAVGYFVAVG